MANKKEKVYNFCKNNKDICEKTYEIIEEKGLCGSELALILQGEIHAYRRVLDYVSGLSDDNG